LLKHSIKYFYTRSKLASNTNWTFWKSSSQWNYVFTNIFRCKLQLACIYTSLLNSLSVGKQENENASNNSQRWTFHVVSSHLGEAASAIKNFFLYGNFELIDEISRKREDTRECLIKISFPPHCLGLGFCLILPQRSPIQYNLIETQQIEI
jgi:hypothetical protein